MPIYEYQCQSCNGEIERLQKIADEPLRECPLCGEPSLKRKISAAGFRLKGAGWYETDFKKSGKKNLAGESGGDKAKGESSAPASSTPAPSSPAPSTGGGGTS